MKKLIHTHVPKVLANYVKPRLNNSVLEVMQNNQIRIFTKPSIFIDDLSDMDLKLKLLNRIHENKSHPTNKKHYDTLYDFILIDQEVEPSFHKRAHDHQDPPTDREGEKRKKRRKVVGQSSKFSRKDKAPMDGSRRNRGLEKLNLDYKNDVELEYHVDQLKAAVLSEAQWNNDEGIEDMVSYIWSKDVHHYQIEALNGIHHWKDTRQDFFKAEINNRTPGSVYSDKKIISVEHTFSYADLPKLNLNDIEDMYLLKVQDKMHHLPSDDDKDFNNALLLFIRRTVIKNRVEDLQLGVKSYQQTLNLTKPKLYFDRIDEKIPYIMTGTEKRIQENLIEMITKNKLGRGNERLRGRDWNYKDVKRSKEMVDKIDQVMKHIEQL
ncbi:hypothetical protein Tco_1096591 [Tanacetum coccineum]